MRRENGSYTHFLEENCEIHGRFGDKVYRRKRNGEPWVYNYVYKPKYAPTVLSRRTTQIARVAAKISNPRRKEYKDIMQKIYYFTPYYVYSGTYSFSCNTFFKLRFKGSYEIELNGNKMCLDLAPRTKLNFVFEEGKEYTIKCYKSGKLYSERSVLVIDTESDLEDTYNTWFAEHLSEILNRKMPYFGRKRVYRRGIIPAFWFQYIVGKTEQGILYRSCFRERFMYVRQPYKHIHSTRGDHFYLSQKNITDCWNATSAGFRKVWAKYHIRWFDANYRKNWKIVRQHNLWSKLIFLAAARLAFELEELSPENWLPGVETLGDLLEICGMKSYGLRKEEFAVPIYGVE